MTSNLRDLIAEEIEQSERTRDAEIDPGTVTRPNRAAARPYTLRLSPDTVDELERLAKDLDVPASTVARGFILQGLAEQRGTSVSTLVDRLAADLARLRRLL